MRAVPAALQAHLDTGATTLCRCWRLDRTDGVSLGFTDHDEALTFDGLMFEAVTGVETTTDVAHADMNVGGLEIAGALTADALSASDLALGLYDGATVSLWLVSWLDPTMRMELRRGTLGEVRRSSLGFEAEVRGPMQALEAVRGRMYTRTSDAGLNDAQWAALPATTLVVSEVFGARLRVSGFSERVSGHFSGGFAEVASGAAAGATVVVAQDAGGASNWLTLRRALSGLEVGDQLSVKPACAAEWDAYRAQFADHSDFRGFPFLPGNDRVFTYARSGQ